MPHIYFDHKKLVHEIAVNNDEIAFRGFFDHYYAKLLHFSFLILRNNDLAKDVVLEVFEKVWEQRSGLINIKDIGKYLLVLVKNKSIDQLRRRKELIAIEDVNTDISEAIVISHPENLFLDQELVERLNAAVLNLPEKCRLVYRLVKEEGLKYKEVSELLNLSTKTIDNHIHNAMSSIRREIGVYLGAESRRKVLWKVVKSISLFLPF